MGYQKLLIPISNKKSALRRFLTIKSLYYFLAATFLGARLAFWFSTHLPFSK